MNITKKFHLLGVVTLACGVAFAGSERTFTGTSGGEFSVAANWSDSTLPGDGDTAIIPDGTTVKVSTAASVTALKAASYLKLNGSTAKLEIVDQAVDFDGGKPQLQGTGVFAASNSGKTYYATALRQDNSAFAGSFSFSRMTVTVYGPKAIGGQEGGSACPVQVTIDSYGTSYVFSGKGNYYNPLTINSGASWQGFGVGSTVDGVVTNFGAVTITPSGSAGSRVYTSSTYNFVQRGTLTQTANAFDACFNVNNAGRIIFDCPVSIAGNNLWLFRHKCGSVCTA